MLFCGVAMRASAAYYAGRRAAFGVGHERGLATAAQVGRFNGYPLRYRVTEGANAWRRMTVDFAHR